jgi:hypothetical protein
MSSSITDECYISRVKFQAVASVVFCLATACSAGDDEPAVEGEEQGTQQGSGVDCSGATTLTSEQWDECTAPRTGTHAVDSRSCEGTPIDQQFRVEPALICRVSAGELTTRCGIGTYCRSHDECNEAPRGRCTGVAICQL